MIDARDLNDVIDVIDQFREWQRRQRVRGFQLVAFFGQPFRIVRVFGVVVRVCGPVRERRFPGLVFPLPEAGSPLAS